MNLPTPNDAVLITEATQPIHSAKQRAVVAVNAELTLLYWQVGRRIAEEVLEGERAEYGQQIIEKLARDLTTTFSRGWQKKQSHHCLRFAECYSETEIVSAVRRQLSWTHFKSLIYIDNPLKREFYMTMAVQERWSTRTLAERIDTQLFERTAISKKSELTIVNELTQLREQGLANQDLVLKDPYVFGFAGIFAG